MTTAILKITNGTDSVDLLELREGISLTLWRQAVAQYKGSGGTFRQSSLSDGRRLVDKRFAEIRDNLQIKIGTEVGGTQEATILILHKLFALLEGASNYWVGDWNYTPVWLESRASCETNTRYAHIVTANIVDLDNVYGSLFQDTGAMSDLTLSIEHGHWCSVRPGTGTATLTSALQEFDGHNLGNVDSLKVREPVSSGAYITNLRVPANITHIYTWSAANGFSANLLGGPFPYNLIDDVGVAPQVNDYVMFGIDQAAIVGNLLTFRSLVFDIGTAQAGLTLAWEGRQGGVGWVAFTSVQDNTATAQPFDKTGVNSLHWQILAPNTLGPFAINGVTAYWVRAKITAIPGAVTIPTQQNRNPYMIGWPYTEVQAGEINGDIHALTRIKLAVQSHNSTGIDGMELLYFNRVMLGLRSLSRGPDFSAYLNVDDRAVANPSGVTVVGAGSTVIGNNATLSSSGKEGNMGGGVAAMADQVVFTLDTTIAPQYYGSYRAFAVFWPDTNPGDIITQLRVKLGIGGETFSTPVAVNLTATLTEYIIVEYGRVDIPFPDILTTDDAMTVEIAIQAQITGVISTAIIHLILMPIDEWAIDTTDQTNDADSTIEQGRYLDIDSIVNPKTQLRSLPRVVSSDEVTGVYLAIKNGPAMLQKNSQQRLWCVMMRTYAAGSAVWISDLGTAATIQIEKCQRYLGPRGTM